MEQEIAPGYRTSKSRAIFLDYYRTLAPDVSSVMGVRWPDVPLTALSTLEHLCKDPRNTVFIVSGCNCDLLTQKFGAVPGLGLVAEHGYFIRRALLGNNARLGTYVLCTCSEFEHDLLMMGHLVVTVDTGSIMVTPLVTAVGDNGARKRRRLSSYTWSERMDRLWNIERAQYSSAMENAISSSVLCRQLSSRSIWREYSRYGSMQYANTSDMN